MHVILKYNGNHQEEMKLVATEWEEDREPLTVSYNKSYNTLVF